MRREYETAESQHGPLDDHATTPSARQVGCAAASSEPAPVRLTFLPSCSDIAGMEVMRAQVRQWARSILPGGQNGGLANENRSDPRFAPDTP